LSQYITIFDFLLFPLYLVFLFFLAKRIAKPHAPDLRKILFTAFFLRMFGSFAYSLMVQYYYGYGDSFTYFYGSNFLTDQVSRDFSNIEYLFSPMEKIRAWYVTVGGDQQFSGYFNNASGNMIMRISALFSYVSFNKFVIIGLFFGFVSFAGQWKLFLTFDDINHGRNRRMLALAVLYSPSIWFWGSGLLKDSICLGAAGFIISILYNTLKYKKISAGNFMALLFMIFLLYMIKSYIMIIFAVGVLIFLFKRRLKKIQSFPIKVIAVTLMVLFIAGTAALFDVQEQISEIAEDSVLQIQNFQQNYQTLHESDESSKGNLEMIELSPSLTSLILKSPGVIGTCIYRPFLWESRSVMILFTSLESTILLFWTLYLLRKTKFFGFFRIISNNEYLLFCFVISMLFAMVIGFTTFNFGTMIRYKIIFLPFYYFIHVWIHSSIQPKKEEPEATNGGSGLA